MGIPPLVTHDNPDSFSRQETYPYLQDVDAMRIAARNSYNDHFHPQNQTNRSQNMPIQYPEQSHNFTSSGPPNSTMGNSQHHAHASRTEHSVQRNSNQPGVSSNDSGNGADERWPLDRVLLWLAHNGFSGDWQETFRTLELKGTSFTELGSKGSFHHVVYPQLAKECVKSGTGWDPGRETEEGKRMRRLIRGISNNAEPDNPGRFYDTGLHSASTDEGVESSPSFPRDPTSALSSNITAENSPGQQFSKIENNAPSQRQYYNQYMTTQTTSNQLDPGSSEPNLTDLLRSEFSRQRHSPSASSDTGFPHSLNRSDNVSHSGSPATQFASISPAGDSHLRFDPNKRNSSDSLMSRGLSSQGIFGGPAASLRSSIGIALGDRRNFQNASPQELVGKQGAGEASHKEQSKGLFNRFRKRIGHDPIHNSMDDTYIDSPVSPVTGIRHTPPMPGAGRQIFQGREAYSGDRPSSSVSDFERPQSQPRKATQTPSKRFAFATPDGWNFRLVDVTDVDAANTLRALLCNSVGIKDPGSALIYLTEPGQIMHEEPLSDTMLVVNRRSKSDSTGSLKFFVQNLTTIASQYNVPQSAGLGLSFGDRPMNGQRQSVESIDDDHRHRLARPPQARRVSPAVANRIPVTNINPSPSSPYDYNRAGSNLRDYGNNAGADSDLSVAQEQHQREVERRQRAYLTSRQEQIQKKESAQNPAVGIRREGVIDFDSPRISPFEEKRTDSLIPLRKPPSVPSGSNTLTKLNSLSKRPGAAGIHGETNKRPSSGSFGDREKPSIFASKSSPANPGQGLGFALVNVGKVSSAIGTPSPYSRASSSGTGKSTLPTSTEQSVASSHKYSPVSPRKDDFEWNVSAQSKGHEASHKSKDSEPRSRQSTISAPERQPVPSISRQPSKSGPDFDFEETEVSFNKSPLVHKDEDEDSDDGLFAMPLAGAKHTAKAKRKPAPRTINNEELKPTLRVDTDSRALKTRSVTFKSPATSGDTPVGNLPPSAAPDSGDDYNQPIDGESANAQSSEPEFDRRASFVRDDVWASRPPVEGMIDHLDEFFPDIDLDEPYLEGGAILSPPASPTVTPSRDHSRDDDDDEGETSGLINFPSRGVTSNVAETSTKGPSDTLGSDESTLKAKRVPGTVAQRSLARSGGLGRMKSIREVAKGAHQVRRNQSVATNNAKSGMLRRKSTKMFGARIMQISPKPGTRLSELEPVPQQAVTHGKIPKRQPTFRIIRGQLIGKGTYGRVYLGINADNGEILAVKQVEVNQKAANYDKDRVREMVAAMDQEIDTMQHLDHPHIVQYLGCEHGELSISIYLEYIPGGSIGSCLRKHGKFEESVVKSLNYQVLSGLAYLHDQGILHRDLKADNILLDLDGTCKISDFGISKKTDNIYGNDVTFSMQGSVFWMAPEVVQSQGQGYSAKVDIWSLGCVVLEMFAGRRPWSKEEAIGAIFKLGSLNQAPPIPEDVSLNISLEALAFMYDCFTM